MLDKLKYLFHRRTLKRLRKGHREKRLPSFDEAKSVLILFRLDSKAVWETVSRCAQELEKTGKAVELLGYIPESFTLDYVITRTHTTLLYEKEHFDFFGMPRAGLLDALVSQPFDLLVDAMGTPNFFAQYVTLKSRAGFRIAYNDTSFKSSEVSQALFPVTEVYDMAITGDAPVNVAEFLNHVFDYLKILKK